MRSFMLGRGPGLVVCHVNAEVSLRALNTGDIYRAGMLAV